ncbi:MAG: S66 peptidase family protein [Myxococcaceae bacterium]
MTFRKPAALKPGDAVRVIAPAGPVPRDVFEEGLKKLSARYSVTYDDALLSRHRYLAGTDQRRSEEARKALTDDSVKAVFCARGGYGSMRLLPTLHLPQAKLRPFVGFSDITAMHLALQAQGWVTFHGPVVTQLGRHSQAVADRLFSLLESTAPAPALKGERVMSGEAEGPLIGGNLSVLSRLLGTPYLPSLDGAVLLLEDVDERPYRLDRMWTHLSLAGVFERVSGIVLGDFTGCEEQEPNWTSAQILGELAAEEGLPCARGFQIGHGDVHLTVPLGVRVRLDADQGSVTFLESAVEARA